MATTSAAKSEQHEEIVRRVAEEAFGAGDLSVIDEACAEDYVQHGPFPEDVRGREGMKESVRAIREAFPDVEATGERYVGDGEFVLYQYTLTGTHEGPFMGVDPTGERVSMPAMVLNRFENGEIAEAWLVADTLGLLRQLGAVPEQVGA